VHTKSILLSATCSLILLASCSDLGDITTPDHGSISREFRLLNIRGQAQTRFAVTDSITFAFKLINSTGRNLQIGMSHGGPFARFQVRRESVVLEDSFEGWAFPANAPRYPFLNNQVIAETWTLSGGKLSRGEFVAVVIPKMTIIETGETFPEETLLFVVE
jgi:hypothetical protein